MNKKLFWLLPIPVALIGLYKLIQNFEFNKHVNYEPEFEDLQVEDKSFDLDEKSLSVVKSHITRNINLIEEDCNWFAIGLTSKPHDFVNDLEGEKMILLAKSKDFEKITELEKIYIEKYQESENSTTLAIDNKFLENETIYFYVIKG